MLLASAAPALAGVGHGISEIGQPGKALAKARTVEIELGDNFFAPGSIEVRAGETVRFILKNSGDFLHEFNIGTAAMHAAHQREMARMMESGMLTPTGMNGHSMNGTLPKRMAVTMKHDDPNSVLVEPGTTRSLVWKFGKKTKLEFACNIPGHYESGMVGNVNFRK
jgi:uncharacterized cupredoxin-like copper-binding protein